MARNSREYHREYGLRTRYGLTPSEVDIMVDEQGGKCAICEQPFNEKRKPQVDHSHKTQKVRGALCGRCNKGLGCFDDDPIRLIKARIYLDTHEGAAPPPPPFDGAKADRLALKRLRKGAR